MNNYFKALPITASLLLGLSTSALVMAETDTSGGERDKAKNGQMRDKPDPYVVEDSKDKGLTSATKPVRKLDHKQKTRGDKSSDSTHHNHEGSSNVTGSESTDTEAQAK